QLFRDAVFLGVSVRGVTRTHSANLNVILSGGAARSIRYRVMQAPATIYVGFHDNSVPGLIRLPLRISPKTWWRSGFPRRPEAGAGFPRRDIRMSRRLCRRSDLRLT